MAPQFSAYAVLFSASAAEVTAPQYAPSVRVSVSIAAVTALTPAGTVTFASHSSHAVSSRTGAPSSVTVSVKASAS